MRRGWWVVCGNWLVGRETWVVGVVWEVRDVGGVNWVLDERWFVG